MPIPQPTTKESKHEFIARCMADPKMLAEYPEASQRFVLCSSQFSKVNLKGRRVSFDYDGVLTTEKGKELVKERMNNGDTIFIISARRMPDSYDIWKTANELGITNVFVTGSNVSKIAQIIKQKIDVHYDDNTDVIDKVNKETKAIGKLWR